MPNLPATTSPKCQQCGARVAYDPESQGLKCGHCQAMAPLPPAQTRGPRELSLERGLETAPRGFGGEAQTVGVGNSAAFGAAGDAVIYLANDRAGHAQLWRVTPGQRDDAQLTFLGAGLGDSFAVLPGGAAIAPVAGQPAAAIVSIGG